MQKRRGHAQVGGHAQVDRCDPQADEPGHPHAGRGGERTKPRPAARIDLREALVEQLLVAPVGRGTPR